MTVFLTRSVRSTIRSEPHVSEEALDLVESAVLDVEAPATAAESESISPLIAARMSTVVEPRTSRIPETLPADKPPVPHNFKDRFPAGVNWWVTGWMAVMHIGAIAALWFFTWPALVAFLVLHWVSAC